MEKGPYVVMREPRLQQAVAIEMLRQVEGWDMDVLHERVVFEDCCSPEDRLRLPDVNACTMYAEGGSAPALAQAMLLADVGSRFDRAVELFNHENNTHDWRRGGRFLVDVGDLEPVRMSLSWLWAAPYMYGVVEDRYEVLRALMDVARRVISSFTSPTIDPSRHGADFDELFPNFADCPRLPVYLPGCAKCDFYAGVATDEIEAWVGRQMQWFLGIRERMREARERFAQDQPHKYEVGPNKRDVRYVRSRTHFDVPAIFETTKADIVIAHAPEAGCTGLFTRHDLDLHAGMRRICDALNEREAGCWVLAENPDGATPRVINGTLGRMPRVQSRMGADEDAMIGLLQDVATNRT